MAKKMELIKGPSTVNLLIDRDLGNPVYISMGGRTKKAIRENWQALRDLCDRTIELEIDDTNLPEN